MLAEGLQIYFSIVKVFAGGGKLKYFYILGWGKCRLFTHLICFYYYSKLSLKANELVNYLISNTYLILRIRVSRFGARLDQVTSKLKSVSLSTVTLHLENPGFKLWEHNSTQLTVNMSSSENHLQARLHMHKIDIAWKWCSYITALFRFLRDRKNPI